MIDLTTGLDCQVYQGLKIVEDNRLLTDPEVRVAQLYLAWSYGGEQVAFMRPTRLQNAQEI